MLHAWTLDRGCVVEYGSGIYGIPFLHGKLVLQIKTIYIYRPLKINFLSNFYFLFFIKKKKHLASSLKFLMPPLASFLGNFPLELHLYALNIIYVLMFHNPTKDVSDIYNYSKEAKSILYIKWSVYVCIGNKVVFKQILYIMN
jgi:hypothetical protein